MKIIVLFTLLFLYTNHCFTQNIFKFGRQKSFFGMKGKVKTSTEETFDLKWENDKIVHESQGKTVSEFTKKGELKKKTLSHDNYEKK